MGDDSPPEGPESPRPNQPAPKPAAPANQGKLGITRRAKPVLCRVILLDGEILETSIHKKAIGGLLFERVCDHLDLLEKEYFGLSYRDEMDPTNTRFWLDVNKTVAHQKKRGKWEFEFGVKFYPPDPTTLKESLTRYLVALQIRKDISTGRLPCTFATQAVLGSFSIQADLGDWEFEEHGEGIEYIQDIPFAPNQTPELLEKIAELHKDRKGMTPEQAELQYLEYAKKIALYGIHLFYAKDSDYVDIQIGVGASGISVFRENLRINRFVWPKVLKISFRRNKFLLRIRPGEFETYESWISFKLPTNRLAKRLWKLAIEHHAFLRLRAATEARRTVLPRFGSKYRYSGRTLYETRVNTSDRPQPFFERTASKQYLNNNRTRSMDSLAIKQANANRARDHNMSVTSTDDSFDTYPVESPTERAVEYSRIIRDQIREEDDEPVKVTSPGVKPVDPPRVSQPVNDAPRVTRPVDDAPRVTRPVDEAPRIIRPIGEAPKIIRPIDEAPKIKRPVEDPTENDRSRPVTEIRVEHKLIRREVREDEITMRLPDPPKDDPNKNHFSGIPTPLAALGLPPGVRRVDDSAESDSSDQRPSSKQKPPTAPKPKKTIVREMDL